MKLKLLFSLTLFVFLGCTFLNTLSAQKFIQMEKYGTLKVKRYYIGESLTYRLKGDSYWYTDVVKDILPDDGLIVFENRAVKVKDITFLKSFHNAAWSKGLALKLYLASGSYVFFSFGGLLLGWTLSALTWQVPLVASAAGLIIRLLFKSKKYKMGKRRWLRLMDLTMKPIIIKP